MKILSIRPKRTILIGGEKFGKGDESVLDDLLTDEQKQSYAARGHMVLGPSKKAPPQKKVEEDDAKREI